MKDVPSPIPLVDPARRYVLFTNAKCGGTTLKSWFFANLDLPSFERRPLRLVGEFGPGFALRHVRRGRRLTPRGAGLRDAEQIRRMTDYYRRVFCAPAIMAGQVEGFFKFAVVRDPATRALSGFLDKFCGADREKPWAREVVAAAGTDGDISFDGFLDYLEGADETACNPHWRRQSYVMEGHAIDTFIRIEALDEGFRAVADRVGDAHFDHLGLRLQRSRPVGTKSAPGVRGDMTARPTREIIALRNRYGNFPGRDSFLTEAARARIRAIYARDYALLPYDA